MLNTNKKIPVAFSAFLSASVIFFILLLTTGFIGLNGGSIYAGTTFNQYIPFIRSFTEVLKGNQSFWYSFSLYAGSGAALNYLYFCMSPFNLLYLIPGFSMLNIMYFIIILKSGLAAASYAFFSEKILKQSKRISLFFSLCWAVSSWSVSLCFNNMWADALYIIPVLAGVIILIVQNRSSEETSLLKGRIYFLILSLLTAVLMFTCFSIGYTVLVFSFLFFILLLFIYAPQGDKNLRYYLTGGMSFIAAMLLGLCLSAALLLPALLFFIDHSSDSLVFSAGLDATLPDILSALFLGTSEGSSNSLPYLYCSLPVLMILPFYFTSENISKRRKISAGIMIVFSLCAMLADPLYILFHIFDTPQAYLYRFVPSVIFMLLLISETAISEYINSSGKTKSLYALILIAFYAFLVLFQTVTGVGKTSDTGLLINSAFLLIWLILFSKHRKTISEYASVISLLLLCAELTVNGYIGLTTFAGNDAESPFRMSGEDFNKWAASEDKISEALHSDDPSLYRIRINGEKNFNSASFTDLNTLTSYGILDDKKVSHTLASLGIATDNRRIYDVSGQPVTDMLLGVKYIFNIDENGEPAAVDNPYALPLAFMSDPSIAAFTPGKDPFDTEENLIAALTGTEYNIYDDVPADKIKTYSFDEEIFDLNPMIAYRHLSSIIFNPFVCYYTDNDADASDTYAWFATQNICYGSPSPSLTVTSEGIDVPLTVETGVPFRGITELPADEIEPGVDQNKFISWTLNFKDDGYLDYALNEIRFAKLNRSELDRAYSALSAYEMNITEFTDDRIVGTVTATLDHPVLFTTIPYDKGWQAYVDGYPRKIIVTTGGTFCALALSEGTHDIIFEYEAPGKLAGLTITSVAVLIWLSLFLTRSEKKKTSSTVEDNKEENNEDNKEENGQTV